MAPRFLFTVVTASACALIAFRSDDGRAAGAKTDAGAAGLKADVGAAATVDDAGAPVSEVEVDAAPPPEPFFPQNPLPSPRVQFREPQDKPPWPGGPTHWLLGGAFGSCTRIDDVVGRAGVCGEAYFGADLLTRWHTLSALRVDLGVGWTLGATSGDRDFGTTTSSGGGYVGLRAMVDLDITPAFFFRIGPQVRGSLPANFPTLGFFGALDLGMRIGDHFEVGIRWEGGAEGVVRASPETLSWAPAFGGSVFAGPVF